MSRCTTAASPAAVAGRTGITASRPVSMSDGSPAQLTDVPVALASSNTGGRRLCIEGMTTAVARR